jgi:rhamnopyranosyl-N-acetylglucosaminyl-diphospho-decaprenol beta-1,3/1,4-galactofuranosyltransferase
MKDKIAAVVVTFNRKDLLRICLNALLKQTRQIDSIIVVNNASEDGTKEMLELEFLNNPMFDYLEMEKNMGGAGGFHSGMKRAYDNGYEWLWLMDDDVFPLEDAIEKYMQYSADFPFIQGRRITQEGNSFEWLHSIDYKTGKAKWIDEQDEFKNKSRININIACFEGAFMSRKVVEKVGLPDPRFFIAGDDTFYGFLVSRIFPMIYIKDITLQRLIDKPSRYVFGADRIIISPFSLYYLVRNFFLLEKFIQKSIPNEIISHKVSIFKKLGKIFFKIILFQKNKINLIITFMRGIKDGMSMVQTIKY